MVPLFIHLFILAPTLYLLAVFALGEWWES